MLPSPIKDRNPAGGRVSPSSELTPLSSWVLAPAPTTASASACNSNASAEPSEGEDGRTRSVQADSGVGGPLPADPDLRALLGGTRLGGARYRRGELGRVGPYVLRKALGAGGMGVTFLVEHEQTRKLACMKVLRPSLAHRTSSRERFIREIESLRAIEHRNVVRLLAQGEIHAVEGEPALPFAVMTYARGLTLCRLVDAEGPLDPGEVARVGAAIACGLDAIHKAGLVHRDLKPNNLILDRVSDLLTILDLGLAVPLEDGQAEPCGSRPGTVAGTPAYMSPEQVKGRPIDGRSDLFALGAVLYTLLSGRSPFHGVTVVETMTRVVAAQPEPLESIRPGLPADLVALVASLMKKDPAERPGSAKEVARSLARIAVALPPPERKRLPNDVSYDEVRLTAADTPPTGAGVAPPKSSSSPSQQGRGRLARSISDGWKILTRSATKESALPQG